MIKVASYNPAENGGEPRIFTTVGKPTRWRISLHAKVPGEIEQRLIVNVEDRMPAAEAHRHAVDALLDMLPEGALCESAGFELWADA